MLETIGLVILAISTLGIIYIVFRKIPVLAEFSLEGIEGRSIFAKLREEIKHNIAPKTASSGQAFLLKILSKARVLFLKGENKMANWLEALRQKSASVKKKKSFSDGYWDKIKIRRGKKPKVIVFGRENTEPEEDKE